MVKRFFLSVLVLAAVMCLAPLALAAPQIQRIPQPIFVNGQQGEGVMIVQNGVPQTTTCANPQQYTTADQSTSGWACFDSSTGTWLLNSQPSQQSNLYYQQPPPVYQEAPSVYDYYGYPYPDAYAYSPYGYYGSPLFGFGFGFGGHGHEHFEHGGGGHGHGGGGGHGHR